MTGGRSPLGKIAPGQFERVIAPHLGAARSEVLVGPRAGQDSAIVKLGGARVLAVTTDPLSVVPALGFEASARLSCHLIASDLWSTGIAPAWASITFNLPPQMSDAELRTYWLAMSDEWARLGVAVVTGHTGRYAGCGYSIIGAGTLMGVGDESCYLTPAMALSGDRVIVTKGCAIEARRSRPGCSRSGWARCSAPTAPSGPGRCSARSASWPTVVWRCAWACASMA